MLDKYQVTYNGLIMRNIREDNLMKTCNVSPQTVNCQVTNHLLTKHKTKKINKSTKERKTAKSLLLQFFQIKNK